MFIAIITDFGIRDPYVGIMKGVILKRLPSARFIDLAHNLPPFSVLSAAYALYSAWNYLPERTIVLSVVDPGVGSDRRELICRLEDKWIVCPDNGTVSLLYRMKAGRNAPAGSGMQAGGLAEAGSGMRFFRASDTILAELATSKPDYSQTFDGRDLFSPLAAELAKIESPNRAEYTETAGLSSFPDCLGEEIDSPLLLSECGCRRDKSGSELLQLKGRILHIDRFGNCISSIHKSDLKPAAGSFVTGTGITIELGKHGEVNITKISTSFSDVREKSPLAYWGSTGFLELAVRNGSAAKHLGIEIDDNISLTIKRAYDNS